MPKTAKVAQLFRFTKLARSSRPVSSSPSCPVVDGVLAEVFACCYHGHDGVDDETCFCDIFFPTGPVRMQSLMCRK